MKPLKLLISLVARDTVFYGIANVLSRSVTLFTLPLLARHLSVEEYGLFDLYYLSISLLITFFIFGQDSAIFRYFYDENNFNDRQYLVTQTITIQIIISSVIIFFLFLFQETLSNFISIPDKTFEFIKLMILIVPFGIMYTFAESILRLTSDLKNYLLLTLGFMIMTLLIIYVSTEVIQASLYDIFKFLFFLWAFFGLLGLFLIRKWLKMPKSMVNLKKMLLYGIPMGAVVLLDSSQAVIERIIIANVVSSEGLGFFAVASKIAIFILLPVGAFQMAFMPLVMRIYRDKNSIKIFNLSLSLYVTGLTLLILILSALAKPITIILAGTNYTDATILIFPLTMAIYFQAISSVIGIGTIISQKTYLRLIILIFVQIIVYFSMFYLGAAYGILGIAVTALLGKILLMLLNGYIGQILYPLSWNYRIIIIMSLISLLCGSYISLNGVNSFYEVIIFILMLLLTIGSGWYTLNHEDKKAIFPWY